MEDYPIYPKIKQGNNEISCYVRILRDGKYLLFLVREQNSSFEDFIIRVELIKEFAIQLKNPEAFQLPIDEDQSSERDRLANLYL